MCLDTIAQRHACIDARTHAHTATTPRPHCTLPAGRSPTTTCMCCRSCSSTARVHSRGGGSDRRASEMRVVAKLWGVKAGSSLRGSRHGRE